MRKSIFLIPLLFFLQPCLFAKYVYSLTRTDLITPEINSTVSAEINKTISTYNSINTLFNSKISPEIDKKTELMKGLIKEKAINDVLQKEILILNKEINGNIFLKEGIGNDLYINR